MSYLNDSQATHATNIISSSSKPYLDSALGDYKNSLETAKFAASYLPYGPQINLAISVGEYLVDKGLQFQAGELTIDTSTIGNYLE